EPAAHTPGCGHARVALPEQAQSAAGFAVPSQFSSTIAASHSSTDDGLIAVLTSLQSVVPLPGATFVWPVGHPPTYERPMTGQLCTGAAAAVAKPSLSKST